VTPLLSIVEGGTKNVSLAEMLLTQGRPAQVGSAEVAAKVLRRFGCSEAYIDRKITYALTGDWPSDFIG
jgi:hypothetical protein